MNCLKEHPMKCHQPFYGSSSGAKVIIPFELAKLIGYMFLLFYYFLIFPNVQYMLPR